METAIFWLVFIFFTIVNLFMLIIKTRTIETVTAHFLLMLAGLIVGITQMLSVDATLTALFCLICVATWLGDLLRMNV